MPASRFRIFPCGGGEVVAVDAWSPRTFQRHSHDGFGIGLITAGAHRSWSGRGQVEAVAGDLITVNPGEVHDGAAVGEARAWSMLYLTPAFVEALVLDASDGKHAAREIATPVLADARTAHLFTRAWAATGDDDALWAHLLVLCGVLLDVAPTAVVAVPPRLRRAQERIDDDPAAPHPLPQLASLAGLSRFQTVRSFVRMTGMTPHAYVIQRRLDLARRLIRAGSMLADAAAQAGFADQSHFHRAFGSRYGFSPGSYAKAFGRRAAISFKNGARTSR